MDHLMTQWEIIFQRFFCLPWRIMFSDVYLAWVPCWYWFYNEFKCCEFSTSRLYKTVGLVVSLGRCHGLAWVFISNKRTIYNLRSALGLDQNCAGYIYGTIYNQTYPDYIQWGCETAMLTIYNIYIYMYIKLIFN